MLTSHPDVTQDILRTFFALHNRSVNAWENARKTLFSIQQSTLFLLQELQESRICQRICLMGSQSQGVSCIFVYFWFKLCDFFVLAIGKM
jgi:hypothetical protein